MDLEFYWTGQNSPDVLQSGNYLDDGGTPTLDLPGIGDLVRCGSDFPLVNTPAGVSDANWIFGDDQGSYIPVMTINGSAEISGTGSLEIENCVFNGTVTIANVGVSSTTFGKSSTITQLNQVTFSECEFYGKIMLGTAVSFFQSGTKNRIHPSAQITFDNGATWLTSGDSMNENYPSTGFATTNLNAATWTQAQSVTPLKRLKPGDEINIYIVAGANTGNVVVDLLAKRTLNDPGETMTPAMPIAIAPSKSSLVSIRVPSGCAPSTLLLMLKTTAGNGTADTQISF